MPVVTRCAVNFKNTWMKLLLVAEFIGSFRYKTSFIYRKTEVKKTKVKGSQMTVVASFINFADIKKKQIGKNDAHFVHIGISIVC